MLQEIDNVVKTIGGMLYKPYALPLILVLAGLYFTVRTRGIQFRMLAESVRILGQKPAQSGGTSSFGALMVSTAARVGTGNVMGVSSAICIGGPGAIFWMWMTAILGSATAFLCLFSGVTPTPEAAGAVYVQASVTAALGQFGPIFIACAVSLFAFTTLIGDYYYTEGCLRFLLKGNPSSRFLLCYRLCATGLIFLGAVITADLAWGIVDLFQAVMVLLNVPTIFILVRPALLALRDYEKQRREGSTPIYRAQDNGVESTEFWQ